MRDIIKRILIACLYAFFLAYIVYLYSRGAVIVQGAYSDLNTLMYLLLFVFASYKFLFYGVYPVRIQFSKITLFVLGVVLLFVGQYVLINTVSESVYIADIVKVFGVLLIVLSPTDILHTDKILKKEKQKGMEIIEV